MKIFGSTRTEKGLRQTGYAGGYIGRLRVYIHVGLPNQFPLLFRCGLCKDEYTHWLCSDKEWEPVQQWLGLETLYLCPRCFVAARAIMLLKSNENHKEV